METVELESLTSSTMGPVAVPLEPLSPARALRSGANRRNTVNFLLDWLPILLLGISVAVAGVWRVAQAVHSVNTFDARAAARTTAR